MGQHCSTNEVEEVLAAQAMDRVIELVSDT